MEFIAGVLVTLIVEFIGYRIWKTLERRQEIRDAYIPPGSQGARRPRPEARDYFDKG